MNDPVTAVMPVWNRRDLLEAALRGLHSQTCPVAEVLVIDDGSTDGSANAARALGARVIQMGAHGGFAKAVNRGIRECRTPLVAIVNNDVELAPDWLEKLSAALQPAAWFATGKILQSAARDRIDATFDVVCRGGTAWRLGNGCANGPSFDDPRAIWSPPFTAALFRKSLFDRIGPLDERFESYLEDVDFGLRCAAAGCPGRYAPGALAWHQGSATMGRWHPEVTRLTARNQVFLTAKHFPARLFWPILTAQLLWGAVAFRHGTGIAWLRGKLQGLARYNELRQPASPGLAEILRENEREIRRVQHECGADLYWRLYFLLTGAGAK